MYIGIDLGGTNIGVGLVDDSYNLISQKSSPTLAERKIGDIIKDMVDLTLSVISEAGYKESDIKSIGIGSPGTIDSKNGIIIYSCNIPFDHTNIRKEFKKHTDIPVYIGNDADVAALGEAYAGAARNVENSVMITLGTGVGGGIIINKHIYSGFNSAGGELGHMVIAKDGVRCNCGRHGCWESYSSATGLIRMTRDAMLETKDTLLWTLCPDINKISGKSAFDGMRKGDKVSKQVVDKYVSYLATGLTNIINIFQPEIICLGGGVAKEGQPLIDMLMPQIAAERYTKDIPQTKIVPAMLGNNAGIIGAALLSI